MPLLENYAMLIVDDVMKKLKEYKDINDILDKMHVDSYCALKENLEFEIIPHLENLKRIYDNKEK